MTTQAQAKDVPQSEMSIEKVISSDKGRISSTDETSAVLTGSKDDEGQPPPPATLPTPPNGGVVAWTQCGGVFCLWFAVWGLVNSSGVYQAFYTTSLLSSTTPSRISWILSLQLCLFVAGASIVGPIYDMGYLRSLLVTGTVLLVLGLMMTSLCTQYWEFILAQGICMGLGMTCLFVPLVAVLPPYFTTKRAWAMGIAASGSSFGAIVFATMFVELQPQIGFGWTMRCIGFVVLASLAFPVLTMRKFVKQSPPRAFIDKSALKEAPYLLTAPAVFLVFAGLYIPYFYIEVYGARTGAVRPNINKWLIVFMGAGSLFGRLLPNFVADKAGPFNTMIVITFITGAVALAWIAATKEAGVITFGVLYGFFSGSYVALTPVVWAALSPNPRVLGTRIGMMTIPQAAGMLIGNPIGGALVHGQSFLHLQIFCGITVMASGCFLLAARVAQLRAGAGWKG